MRRHSSAITAIGRSQTTCAPARGLDRVVAVQGVRQREIDGLHVVALQRLAELVVVIARRAMLLGERLGARAVGRNDRGQPCLSSGSREGRQQRAFNQRPCADDGIADLLGQEPFSQLVSEGEGCKREAMEFS